MNKGSYYIVELLFINYGMHAYVRMWIRSVHLYYNRSSEAPLLTRKFRRLPTFNKNCNEQIENFRRSAICYAFLIINYF